MCPATPASFMRSFSAVDARDGERDVILWKPGLFLRVLQESDESARRDQIMAEAGAIGLHDIVFADTGLGVKRFGKFGQVVRIGPEAALPRGGAE